MAYHRQLMEKIVAVAPGFAPIWDNFVREWSDEEFLPLCLAMSELGDYLVDCCASQATDEFEPVFGLVEEEPLARPLRCGYSG